MCSQACLRCRAWGCLESPQSRPWGEGNSGMGMSELRMPGTSWADSPMKLLGLGALNPRFGVQAPGLGCLNPNSSSKFRVCLGLGLGSEQSPGSCTLNFGVRTKSRVLYSQFWVLILGTGPSRPFSPRRLLMATPAAGATASRCNPVAGAQGRIAAEAGHGQGECSQCCPARSGPWVAGLAGARV